MKKLLLAAVFIFAGASLKAQIPNANFECWNLVSGSPQYEEPCSWTSYNPSSQFGYPVFVYKTTDAHTGTYACEVRTVSYTNPLPPYNQLVEVGVAQMGQDYQNGPNGFPYTQRPNVFSGWVKYAPQGVDSAMVKVKLFKYNQSTGQQDDVANAEFYVKSTDTAYHCKMATFAYTAAYMTSGNPDSAFVLIRSSFENNPTAGSVVKVDDIVIGIACAVGIEDVTAENTSLQLYPNPASDMISFSALPAGADRIKIFEKTGRMVSAEAVSGSHAGIDVKRFSPGIYFYAVYDDSNKLVSSGKFNIIR